MKHSKNKRVWKWVTFPKCCSLHYAGPQCTELFIMQFWNSMWFWKKHIAKITLIFHNPGWLLCWNKESKYQHYNYIYFTGWMNNLVSHINGRTETDTVWYQAAEGNMKNTSHVGSSQFPLFTSYHRGVPQGQATYFVRVTRTRGRRNVYSLTFT
jgi:hypothetical protein